VKIAFDGKFSFPRTVINSMMEEYGPGERVPRLTFVQTAGDAAP